MNNTVFKAIVPFECENCGNVFGMSEQKNECNCPNCLHKCRSLNEGFMVYNQVIKLQDDLNVVKGKSAYEEELLTAEDIAKILGKSKRVAYEIMEEKGFPLIRIRRSKRVLKSEFFQWLKENRGSTAFVDSFLCNFSHNKNPHSYYGVF